MLNVRLQISSEEFIHEGMTHYWKPLFNNMIKEANREIIEKMSTIGINGDWLFKLQLIIEHIPEKEDD